jgi:hypothetical protein
MYSFSRLDALGRHKATGTCSGSRHTHLEGHPAPSSTAQLAPGFVPTAPITAPHMGWPTSYQLPLPVNAQGQQQQFSATTYQKSVLPQPLFLAQGPTGDWRLYHYHGGNIRWSVPNGEPSYVYGDASYFGGPMVYPPSNQVYHPQPSYEFSPPLPPADLDEKDAS